MGRFYKLAPSILAVLLLVLGTILLILFIRIHKAEVGENDEVKKVYESMYGDPIVTIRTFYEHRFDPIYIKAAHKGLNGVSSLISNAVLFVMGDNPKDRLTVILNGLDSEDNEEARFAKQLMYIIRFNFNKADGQSIFEINSEIEVQYVPVLLDHLQTTKSEFARQVIIETLGFITYQPNVVPVLLTFTADKSPDVRAAVAGTLSTIDPNSPTAQDPRLKEAIYGLMDDSDPSVKCSACNALRLFGRTDRSIALLKKAADDLDTGVRTTAIYNLTEIGLPSDALPFLIRSLNANDCTLLNMAIQGLEKIGPDAVAALPELRRIVRPETRVPCPIQDVALKLIKKLESADQETPE
jgi:hypothetical protein